MHQQKINEYLDEVIAKASEVAEISDEEALALSRYSEDHLIDLCGAASKVRNLSLIHI